MKKDTLYLIDISSFIFRAFFAIRSLSTSKGVPVNAVYGVMTMLINLIEKNKPEYVLCVFDTPAPSFRKEIYKEYKANRGEPPDELKPQFELIHRAVEALGLYETSAPGFEADDLIGSLVQKFKDKNIVIVTGDKDLMQLVDERVAVLDTMKNILYSEKEVEEKLGVPPKYVTDYLGLIGDSSDNIPGVEGIGPKTAVELIKNFGSLENILKSADQIKSEKRRETLKQQADIARLSKELATVRCDLDKEIGNVDLKEIKYQYQLEQKFFDFLDQMEFKALKQKYANFKGAITVSDDIQETESKPFNAKTKSSESEKIKLKTLAEFFETVKKQKSKHLLLEYQLASQKWSELEVNFLKLESDSCVFMQESKMQKKDYQVFYERISEAQTKIYTYDLKHLLKASLRNGVEFAEVKKFSSEYASDLLIAHYLLEPEEKHDLEKILGAFDTEGLGLMQANFGLWMKVVEAFEDQLKKQELVRIFRELEMPLCAVLARIEHNGVQVDKKVLSVLSKEYEQEIKEIEKFIFDTVGTTFNLNSPKQLSHVLFEQLKLPVISKTKTGYSTDAEVLHKLSKLHPVPEHIVRYRELTKLKSTYIDVLPGLVDTDGRIHALFNQAVAATGRLSSSDPNLQNIPIKTPSGRKIRKAFVSESGSILVGADYSQIELRIVAELSGDARLIKAFQEGKDIHKATAAEIFHIKEDDVTGVQRATAKAINFGLIYGKSAFGLSQELGITRTEAQNYIQSYFNKYSGVKAFMDKCISDARQQKYAITHFGRRRQIKDIDNKNMAVRSNAERMAMNTPVQGTAADIIKMAMLSVANSAEKLGAKFILSVHDELVLEVPKDKQETAEKQLCFDMENVISAFNEKEFKVKLTAEVSSADNWMDL